MDEFKQGELDVIVGPVSCGKSEELIRRLKRAIIAKRKIQVFKPIVDNRILDGQKENCICSRNKEQLKATPVISGIEILNNIDNDTKVIGIDEVEMFEDDIVTIIRQITDQLKLRVIVSGLDMDFRGEPFSIISKLLSIAENIDKLNAICMRCGNSASMSQRLLQSGKDPHWNDPVIIPGDDYEARCKKCHVILR